MQECLIGRSAELIMFMLTTTSEVRHTLGTLKVGEV